MNMFPLEFEIIFTNEYVNRHSIFNSIGLNNIDQ